MCGTKVTLAPELLRIQILGQPHAEQGIGSGVVFWRASSRIQGRAFGSAEHGLDHSAQANRYVYDDERCRREQRQIGLQQELVKDQEGRSGWPGFIISIRPRKEGGEGEEQ